MDAARTAPGAHRPLILISPSTWRREPGGKLRSMVANNYSEAILAAGGLPVIIPCLGEAGKTSGLIRELVERTDGVLLTGGDDVNPKRYGAELPEPVMKTVCMDGEERDEFELELISEVWRQKRPTLAICRGMQILNVALGGTLIADIPLQMPGALEHRRHDASGQRVHGVEVQPGTLLAQVLNRPQIGVNSTHHQAVDRLAKVFRPNAVSTDGIVEGLELAKADMEVMPYLLAVQFHPEHLWADHPEHLILFQSFVSACRRNRQSP